MLHSSKADLRVIGRMEHMETWMLMEYCERGSLEFIIRTGRSKLSNGQPNLPMIIACLLDIASGRVNLVAPAIVDHWMEQWPLKS